MTIRFSKEEMQKAMKQVKTSVKSGKGQPSSLKMKAMNGKTYTMKQKAYCGLFDNQAKFFIHNSRLPNYCTYLYDSNTGFVGQEQPNEWTCGSTSLANASTQILTYKTEKQCRTACNTTTNGTSPNNLIKGAEKLGMKVEKINRTFNAVKSAISKGYSVIAHIETGDPNLRCVQYKKNYGHWISIYDTTQDYKFKIFDPSRTYKVCNANQIIKATNNRAIYFYQVKPL